MSDFPPLISFGIIVLNGEPFTRYCIRSVYSYAHEIIIAEGACEGSRNVATHDGHSSDGTLEILREIKRLYDPANKIHIITAEDEGHKNGFWPGEKHEQSQAYAKRATGNYLWQVDIDEFYKDEDIRKIMQLLDENPEISAISFKQLQFWGGFKYLVDSWYLRRGNEEFHRLFKWGPGYEYTTHRPPTVINEKGQDTRSLLWLGKKETIKRGIFLYHYSFVFPKQVFDKAEYYKNAEWSKREQALWWAEDVFMKLADPYKVFSITWTPSWLRRYKGNNPVIIDSMIEDIKKGIVKTEIRPTEDIEYLLNTFSYNTGVFFLKLGDHLDRFYHILKSNIRQVIKTLTVLKKR